MLFLAVLLGLLAIVIGLIGAIFVSPVAFLISSGLLVLSCVVNGAQTKRPFRFYLPMFGLATACTVLAIGLSHSNTVIELVGAGISVASCVAANRVVRKHWQ